MGAMVTGVLLVAGAAMAQTAGSTLGAASPPIVPVTGPSTWSDLHGAAKPEAAPARAPAPAKVANGEGAHKPAAKPTAKKASAGKHLAKGAGTAKSQHVASAKPQPVAHRAAVKKPMPATTGPAKRATPPQPVLPRV
jgi:hypothetical protein